MNKESRIQALLNEKRISYNPDGDFVEGNRVRGLYDLIQECFEPDFVVVEIGSCEGSSAELFALTCGKVYAIDPWEGVAHSNGPIELAMSRQSEKTCRVRLNKYNNVEIIKGLAEEEVNSFKDRSVDAVYIDGAHDPASVAKDINMWLPKIKDGGVLCGHDWRTAEVRNVVLKMFGGVNKIYKDGSWAIILKK